MSDNRQNDPYAYEETSSGPSVVLVLSIALLAIIAIFILQNQEQTEIELLFFRFESSTWVLIVLSILLGVLLDRLLIMWRRKARRRNDDRG